MSETIGRYELTTSLGIGGGSPESLDAYVARLDHALLQVLGTHPTVTAYFTSANYEAFEVQVGLRFEGMEPRHIEEAASHILDECIEQASSPTGEPAALPVREESTLVPA